MFDVDVAEGMGEQKGRRHFEAVGSLDIKLQSLTTNTIKEKTMGHTFGHGNSPTVHCRLLL